MPHPPAFRLTRITQSRLWAERVITKMVAWTVTHTRSRAQRTARKHVFSSSEEGELGLDEG